MGEGTQHRDREQDYREKKKIWSEFYLSFATFPMEVGCIRKNYISPLSLFLSPKDEIEVKHFFEHTLRG